MIDRPFARSFTLATTVTLLVAGMAFGGVLGSEVATAQPGPLDCGTVDDPDPDGQREVVVATSQVGTTWAGHYVDQALLTDRDEQYVGYYDADRQLTVAHRHLDRDEWVDTTLDETIDWDSHNYITLAVDRDGHLHVAGNMHNHPLKYFRTSVAGDVSSLERVETMVDPGLESQVTYPVFLELDDGTVVFRYREGGSGDGIDIYNQYDETTQSWSGLLESPVLDGEGERNAYAAKPQLGPDGNYHMVWVWRDTPNAATTHTVSYARSSDLANWETSAGESLQLPITLDTSDVVDPAPPFGGVINNNVQVGFDPAGDPVVAYHRYDEDGNTQIFVARPDDSASGWHNVQVSDWSGAWEFSEGGTLVFEVELYWAPELTADGDLRLDVTCHGDARTFLIDAGTLEPIEEIASPLTEPADVSEVRSDYEHDADDEVGTDMQVNLNDDSGAAGSFHARPLLPDPDVDERHLLRWESLGENQDRPRAQWPDAQPIEVVTLGDEDDPTDPEPPGQVCARHQGGASFPDSPGSGHREFIDCLAELGIVEGMADGWFRPADEVTREQLASFVVRALELATGETMPSGGPPFPDVGATSTHGQAVAKLRHAGIVQGYADGTFRPREAVTRDQTARYVVNALEHVLGTPLATSAQTFPDVPSGSQYAGDVDKLVTAGVVSGFTDGTFGPREHVTRGQMTRFIGNALEVLNRAGAYQGP